MTEDHAIDWLFGQPFPIGGPEQGRLGLVNQRAIAAKADDGEAKDGKAEKNDKGEAKPAKKVDSNEDTSPPEKTKSKDTAS